MLLTFFSAKSYSLTSTSSTATILMSLIKKKKMGQIGLSHKFAAPKPLKSDDGGSELWNPDLEKAADDLFRNGKHYSNLRKFFERYDACSITNPLIWIGTTHVLCIQLLLSKNLPKNNCSVSGLREAWALHPSFFTYLAFLSFRSNKLI